MNLCTAPSPPGAGVGPVVGAGGRGSGQGSPGRGLDLHRLLAAWVINLQISSASGDCFLSSGTFTASGSQPIFPEQGDNGFTAPPTCLGCRLVSALWGWTAFYLQPWDPSPGLCAGDWDPGPSGLRGLSGQRETCDSGTSDLQPCRIFDGGTLGVWGNRRAPPKPGVAPWSGVGRP